jgi:hypothetical protein
VSNDQAKKDYLEAFAKYEEHMNMAVYAFLLGKYSERKIRKNPNLIDQHMDEFMLLLETSNGLIFQWVRDDLEAMNTAKARM